MIRGEEAFDGEEGLYLACQNIFNIIVLDMMLPHLDGYGVLEGIRAAGIVTPVLVFTAKDGIDDKIKGFKYGADDYLVKPFHHEELILRVQAIIRRATGALRENTLRFLELGLNLLNRTAKIGEVMLELSGTQFDISEYLMHNQGIIVTKKQIFDRIWGFDSDTTTNVVEVYCSNLRKSLKKYSYDRYILTIRGMGYLLTGMVNNDE